MGIEQPVLLHGDPRVHCKFSPAGWPGAEISGQDKFLELATVTVRGRGKLEHLMEVYLFGAELLPERHPCDGMQG
ncbi:MAG: hypothetical protein ACRDJK_09980, partial [Actinomycetota bacterium]